MNKFDRDDAGRENNKENVHRNPTPKKVEGYEKKRNTLRLLY